jgi:hypothetical protein
VSKDEWVQPYLEALRRLGKRAPACRAIGVNAGAVAARVKIDADFAAAEQEAIDDCVDDMEAEMIRRARDGIEKPVIYQGELQYLTEPMVDLDGAVMRSAAGHVLTRLVYSPDGKPRVLTTNERSDALLMFGLKGYRKRTFAERTELTGADGSPLDTTSDTERAARVAALLELARSRKDGGDIL